MRTGISATAKLPIQWRFTEDDPKRFELKRAIQQRFRQRLPKVDFNAAMRHIDHVVKLVGPDHVGLGSDFDGVSGMVLPAWKTSASTRCLSGK